MDKYLEQLRAFLRSLTLNQRLMLGACIVVVGLVVWLFVRLFGAIDYKPLYTGLDPTDTEKIVQRLSLENIPYQLSSDSTSIDVPSENLDKVRIEMASENLPHTGRVGFELFDKPNWSSSDFSERVNYQRALEAELERTIETMDTVESARVHLVLPHDSLFTTEERPAKAAVVVKLRTQRGATETVNSIANLVASSWENLSPDDVTIVSADGRLPLLPGKSGAAGSRQGLSDMETVIAERIVDTLAPIVGADHVKSSVTLEYDSSSGESTQELYDPNAVALVTSQVTEDNSSDANAAGIPGTPSNVPTVPPAAPPGGQPTAAVQAKATNAVMGVRSESKTFAVSKTVHHTVEPPGKIKRLAAAVLVDDVVEDKQVAGKTQETRRKRTPEEMVQLENLVKAAIGYDAPRGDELAVQNVAFQEPPAETPVVLNPVQRTIRVVTPYIGLLRYVGVALLFLLIYLLVLAPIKNQVLSSMRALAAPEGQQLLPAGASAATARKAMSEKEIASSMEAELMEASTEVKRAVVLKRHLADKVKKEPEGASRLIQSWIREEPE